MNDHTEHEIQIMEKLDAKNREVMKHLSPKERKSLEQHVTPENIEQILTWIGSDSEIEKILFWDRGGKFDDVLWQNLTALDQTSAVLFEKGKFYFKKLKQEAIESQRRSDLTLLSQFNSGLLFTGIAPAVRCDEKGNPDEKGTFFSGIELRCIGSVADEINSITVFPNQEGQYDIHFGSRINGADAGIWVYTKDKYSLLQLAQVAQKELPKKGIVTLVEDGSGKPVELDAKLIRKATMDDAIQLSHEREMVLHGTASSSDPDEALSIAGLMSHIFYERFGLETECYKIGKAHPNFKIMREENFHDLLPEDAPIRSKGLVMLTATNVCRRCRREMMGFREFAVSYPDVDFALVNLSSPQFAFYERVFRDMGGGDAETFRKTASGVTPFLIIYAPDENGVLTFREYYATGKSQDTPSMTNCRALLDKYFR